MKIYEDIALIEQAIDGLIDSHDVFDGETEQALHNLMAARQETIENGIGTLCKLRVHKQTELDGIKAEIARLTLAKKRLEKTVAWAESEIHNLYKANGGKKTTIGTFTVSTRTSTQVQVDDGFDVSEYMRETITREPDKMAIKEALKSGKEIDGAWLVEKENIQIK